VTPLPFSSRGGRPRRHTHLPSQDTADVAKFRLGSRVLHQVEDVALGLAERIPPASSVVVDD
jgi:hypothetical protein